MTHYRAALQVAMALCVFMLARPVFAGSGASPGVRDGHATQYFQHHKFKAVFEVPTNPKLWPAVTLVLTHNITSLIGHGIQPDVVLVAPGPAIHFFMKKFDAANYKQIEVLNKMGVRMLACHAALVAFHVNRKELFPHVGVAYPSGVIYILKKQAQGYTYYTWP